jgi:hypothetical protein
MAKKLAMILGVVFLLVGVLGFIPNPIVGSKDAMFLTNGLHNFVHILSGIVLIIAAKSGDAARMALIVVGVVYLLVTILGFVAGEGTKILNLIPVNAADNYLHLLLTIVLLGAGFMSKPASTMPASTTTPQM